MNKETLQTTPDLMTRATEARLKNQLDDLQDKINDAGREIGITAGHNHDWHDNYAYDEAVRNYQLLLKNLSQVKNSLIDPQHIDPRMETEMIGLGNTVLVQFEGEDNSEEFTLLGKLDSGTNRSWISYESPIGEAMMNRRSGDTIEYKVRDRKIQVKIKNIIPGQFE